MGSIFSSLTNEKLNQLMIEHAPSFYDFSENISKGRIASLAPPFESYQTTNGDIISFCASFFDTYNEYLAKLIEEDLEWVQLMMHNIVEEASGRRVFFDLKKDVEDVEKMIIATLAQYFKGLPSEAVSVFEKGMLANNMHLFELIPQISISSAYFYRIRKDRGGIIDSGKELFHVPFEHRIYCGTYRYSIPGYPSLYLAKKLNIAKIETGISDTDSYYAACFSPQKELCFIDLALTRSFDKIWERYSLLVFYPLIMACGLKVRFPEAPFKPEYVLPQVMAQVFRLHDKQDTFNGFSYISTKLDKPDFMDINMRNFVLWIKGADEEKGYSESLANLFTVSGPLKCSGDRPTEEIEVELIVSPFLPVLD